MNESIQELRTAAEEGDVDAQFRLACCLAGGTGVPKDETEAEHWMLLAAEQGHADARKMLGCEYGPPTTRLNFVKPVELLADPQIGWQVGGAALKSLIPAVMLAWPLGFGIYVLAFMLSGGPTGHPGPVAEWFILVLGWPFVLTGPIDNPGLMCILLGFPYTFVFFFVFFMGWLPKRNRQI